MGIEFIIPTYSRTEHLFTIVCSILSQTNPNWKFVTDFSSKFPLAKFGKIDKILYVHN